MKTIIYQFNEQIATSIEGTIIDFETIGEFNRSYNSGDPKYYMDILPVIFGIFDLDGLQIFYIKNKGHIPELLELIEVKLQTLICPFYAFNHEFEKYIIYNQLKKEVKFNDLQIHPYEKKEIVCKELGIPDYEDPFKGIGKLCIEAWLRGDYENCLKHNRACLLKEADLLRIRGCNT